jgi:hypothetical protein
MPSPLAHSIIGVSAYMALRPRARKSFVEFLKEDPRELFLFIFASNLPDMDMVAGLAFSGNIHAWHAKISHSIIAAAGAALLAGLVYPKRAYNRRKVLITIFALVLIHDLMDFASSPDLAKRGPGIWLLYPLKELLASPFPLFFGFRHRTMEQILSTRNFLVLALEAFEFGLVLTFMYLFKNKPLEYRAEGVNKWAP